jgi:hypothetical protein
MRSPYQRGHARAGGAPHGTGPRWRCCRGCTRATRFLRGHSACSSCFACGRTPSRRRWAACERVSRDVSRSWSSRPSVPQPGCGFLRHLRRVQPAAPYAGNTHTSLSRAPRGLSGLILDQQFGLLPNAPVYLVALSGIGALWRAHRRLASELLLVAVPYAVAVSCYHMWWGGHSSPVRFIVPVLLPFGLSAAAHWARSTSRGRGTFNVLLGASVALALALTLGGSRCARVQLSRRIRDLDGPRRTARQPCCGRCRHCSETPPLSLRCRPQCGQPLASCHGSSSVLSAAPQRPARTPMNHVGQGFSPAMKGIALIAAVALRTSGWRSRAR